MKNIAKGSLLNLKVLCPAEKEQRAIATALSDADALIESLDRLIAKKRAIEQAAMQQLLTGQTRLPGFTDEWETKPLGEVVDLKNGYAFKSTTYRDSAYYKIITISNVQDGYIELGTCSSINALPSDLQEHQVLSPGDILISMTGNVGRVCVVDRKNCLQNQRVGKIIPRSTNKRFLFFLLHDRRFMHDMIDSAVGGAQGNIGKNDILSYSCLIPASIKEQTAIATALSDMDTEIEALEHRRDKTRQIKQGMMQQLLTGRVRLVEPRLEGASQ